jgi:hypothetical protein
LELFLKKRNERIRRLKGEDEASTGMNLDELKEASIRRYQAWLESQKKEG